MHSESDDKKIIINLDKPLREALAAQKNYLNKLRKIQTLLESDEPLDEGLSTHLYRLVLQHRLDKESVLKNLMRSNKHLCLALGLEENGSVKHNLDMLITQLGTDNFYKELSLLSHLVDKLNKALALTEKTKAMQKQEKALFDGLIRKIKRLTGKKVNISDKKEYKPSLINGLTHGERIAVYGDTIEHELRLAAGLQAYFSQSLRFLTDAYQAMPGLPKFGPVYDYMIALNGPFTDITAMIQNGIELTDNILRVLSNKLGILPQKTVNQLFHQTNNELDHLYQLQKSMQHDYALHKKDLELMSIQLNAEIDAEAKVSLGVQRSPQSQPASPSPQPSWKSKALNIFNRG